MSMVHFEADYPKTVGEARRRYREAQLDTEDGRRARDEMEVASVPIFIEVIEQALNGDQPPETKKEGSPN